MVLLLCVVGGLLTGLLAGLFGVGGGVLMVPLLVALGYAPVEAIATSSLAMVITSLAGTVQNWRMGLIRRDRVVGLGVPAVVATQLGVAIAVLLPKRGLLMAFGILMLVNLGLVSLRQRIEQGHIQLARRWPPPLARLVTGGLGGSIAGMLGVGGGAILVPLQMLLLQDPLKRAIQNSLAVVFLTAVAATLGHGLKGNVQWDAALALGLGGLVSVQASTRWLPKLSDRIVSFWFRVMLVLSALYSFWRAFVI